MKSFSPLTNFCALVLRAIPRRFCKVCVALLVCFAIPVFASAQIQNGEFDSLTGWFPFGPVQMTNSNDAYQGGKAGQIKNRSLQWHGIAQSLLGKIEPGKDYHVTSYIKLLGATDKTVQLQIKRTDDRGTRYFMIGEIRANDSEWTLSLIHI